MFERRGADALANTGTQAYQSPGQITYLADGRLLIVWTDESGAGGADLRGRIYNSDGAPAAGEFAITAKAGVEATPFAFALPGGGFVLTWTERAADSTDWNVVAQTFGADGAPVGAEIAVHAASPLEQSWPAGAALADGGFVIAWHGYDADPTGDLANSNIGIMAQRFDSAGAPVGAAVEVNSSQSGSQANVSVAALANGGWIAVWDDFGPQSGIAAQRYGANGAPVGGEFLVSTETAGTQQHNIVAALPDGGFVVAWTGTGPAGTGQAVRARIYGADGAPLAGEFIVNEGNPGSQSFPSIAVLASGSFIVAWRDGSGRDGSGTGRSGAGVRFGGRPARRRVRRQHDHSRPAIRLFGGGFRERVRRQLERL
jgi:hypothetical protein